MVTAAEAVFCFPCRERLLPMWGISDFQIADVLSPSKQVILVCLFSGVLGVAWVFQVLFLLGHSQIGI